MKKTLLILALLLALLCGQAAAARITYGSAGTHSTFGAAYAACSAGDTLVQSGSCRADTLTTTVTLTKAFHLYPDPANPSDSIYVRGDADGIYRISSTAGIVFHDVNWRGTIYVRAGAFTWIGGTYRHPGTSKAGAVTANQGFYVGASGTTTAILSGIEFLKGGATGQDIAVDGSGTHTYATFTECEFPTYGTLTLSSGKTGDYVRFVGCLFNGGGNLSAGTSGALDSLAFRGCTWNPVVGTSHWALQLAGATKTFFDTNTVLSCGNRTAGAPWCSILLDNMAARKLSFTNSTFPLSNPCGAAPVHLFQNYDSTRALVLEFDNLDIGGGAYQDSVGYAIYSIYSEMDSFTVKDSNFDCGTILTRVNGAGADTTGLGTAARRGGRHWNLTGITMDHVASGWTPRSASDRSIQVTGDRMHLSDIVINDSRASHAVALTDDGLINNGWSAAANGKYASHSLIENVTVTAPSDSSEDAVYFGIVDKGRANTVRNYGADIGTFGGGITSALVSRADSSLYHNFDIHISDPDRSTVVWTSQQGGNYPTNVLMYNVRATGDYYTAICHYKDQAPTDTIDFVVKNSCFATTGGYSREFYPGTSAPDGYWTLDATSFTDSLSWRMKWGGKRDIAGTTANAWGGVNVGINPPTGALASGAPAPVVWPFRPSGVSAYDWVAGDWHALLDLIDDGSLKAVTLGTLSTYYLIPPAGLSGDTGRARLSGLERQWNALGSSDKAKIEWLVW